MTEKKIRKLEADLGEHISGYVKRLLAHKKELSIQRIGYMLDGSYNCDVEGEFNGVVFHVTEHSTEEELVAFFDAEIKRKRAEYEASDAYKARQEEEEATLKILNAEATVLIEELRNLDFSDYKNALFWAKKYQPYSDRSGVIVPKKEILKLFTENGYEINANTDDQFNGEDAENHARWIIGQALDGIQKIGAMHPMTVTFTERWEEKFSVKQ